MAITPLDVIRKVKLEVKQDDDDDDSSNNHQPPKKEKKKKTKEKNYGGKYVQVWNEEVDELVDKKQWLEQRKKRKRRRKRERERERAYKAVIMTAEQQLLTTGWSELINAITFLSVAPRLLTA